MGITPNVLRAKLLGDRSRLSELGYLGNLRKKEKARRKNELEEIWQDYKLRKHLHSSAQMAREANEHIAPIT